MKLIVNIVIATTLVSLFSCKKKDDSKPEETASTTGGGGNPSGLTSTTAEYVNFSLNGSAYSFTAPVSGLWATGYDATIFTQPSMPNYIYTSKSVYQNSAVSFQLQMADTTRQSGSLTDNTFRTFIQQKNYNYATSAVQSSLGSLNLKMDFKDNASTNWSTVKSSGSTLQAGSSFSITQVGEYTAAGNTDITRKIKATFNCKVYNSSGDSLNVTNGELILSINK